MPLFKQGEGKFGVKLLRAANFESEKMLQTLIEKNLEAIFNCRFVATEFSTGVDHGGRIDTLAISEDNNPVIIEYKVESDGKHITQSLYYLSWIRDHHGDFEIAVDKALGDSVKVDWERVRVLCVGPSFNKFDLHAAGAFGPELELWQYRRYEDGSLYLDEVLRRSGMEEKPSASGKGKNPVMVEGGKKAAITRATTTYSFDSHLNNVREQVVAVGRDLREYILGLDKAVGEYPVKKYIAFKVAQNFTCLEFRKSKLLVFLKLDPKRVKLGKNARDVSKIGHYGTGDIELTVNGPADLVVAKEWIKKAYDEIGG